VLRLEGDAKAMNVRARAPVKPGRPTPPWMAGIVIGMTIAALAAGAMLAGSGAAISKAIARGK
jgi:hypothetical protein